MRAWQLHELGDPIDTLAIHDVRGKVIVRVGS